MSCLSLNNPSSSDIKDSVKALVGLFIFMSGTVKHLLSAFEVHPYDKQAWLSTCAIILHHDFYALRHHGWNLLTHIPDVAGLKARCRPDVMLEMCLWTYSWRLTVQRKILEMLRQTNLTPQSNFNRVCLCLQILHFCSLRLGKLSSWVEFPN